MIPKEYTPRHGAVIITFFRSGHYFTYLPQQHDPREVCSEKWRPSQGLEVKKLMTSSLFVGVVMGSQSDWETMRHAVDILDVLAIPCETRIVSAHRTPDLLFDYASTAASRGLEVIIAGAGGAAHLPGMLAAKTFLPILGVPIQSKTLSGLDSLLSIVQMPAGIPVATLAIGHAGAVNAALLAAAILANKYPEIQQSLKKYRQQQTAQVLQLSDPRQQPT